MVAVSVALESVPAWLVECKTAIEAMEKGQKEGAQVTFAPSKLRDGLMEAVDGVPEHIRLFLLAVARRSFNAKLGEREKGKQTQSQRQKIIAERMKRCQRTVQNDVVQAEKAGFIEVERQSGLENVYHIGVSLLLKIGALYVKPKVEARPAPAPPPPSQIREAARKAEDCSAQYYRLLNEGKSPDEAKKMLGLGPQPKTLQKSKPPENPMASGLRECLSTLGSMKSLLPSRAG